MRKTILVPALLIFVSSCTLPFNKQSNEQIKDDSFAGLYNASIHSSMVSLEEFGTTLGINRHESIEGSILSSLNVPGILSGSLSSQYTGLVDGRNAESFLRNIRVLFTSLVSSGSLSIDEIGFVSHSTDSLISYKNIVDIGLIPDEMKTIFKKYENTWLNISQKSLSEMSPDELIGYNVTKNLLTKSSADIEKYATDYPVWKTTADLGMSGSIHTWSIELDRTNILALVKKISLDLSGTGISDEYAKKIETNLASISFSGTLGFDSKNPKVSILEGSLSSSGKLVAGVVISRNENKGSITLTNSEEKTNIVINYGKIDSKNTLTASINQGGNEMGNMNAYIENRDGKLKELSIEASAQGMTVSLKHTMNGDTFGGKLSAIVGTMEWSGTMSNDRLTGLKINGTAPFGNLSVNLASNGSDPMVKGPVVVKSGQETLVSATLGLEIAREKFGILLDVASGQFPVHFDLMISGKSTPSDKKVTLPNSTKSLQDLMKEIELLTPTMVDIPTLDDTSTFDDTLESNMN